MRIQSIGRNTSFGDLCRIQCNDQFDRLGQGRKHYLLINDLLESDAFKKLGEKYDYEAKFSFKCASYEALKYDLDLIPTKNPTPGKKLPNLPIYEINVIHSEDNSAGLEAFSEFREKLKNMSFEELDSMVQKEVDDQDQDLRKAQKHKNECQRAINNIKNSRIPIDYNI